MSSCSTLCLTLIVVLFFNMMLVTVRLENNAIQVKNRTCIPAEPQPSLNSNSCHPLINFTEPFCKNHGIIPNDYVFQSPDDQNHMNYEAILMYKRLGIQIIKQQISNECITGVSLFACHNYLSRCDSTKGVFQRQLVCRESCLEFVKKCGAIFQKFKKVYLVNNPEDASLLNCERQPYRNAGESPECWYYNGKTEKRKELSHQDLESGDDCLYLNGSSYQGNISITVSGTPCQSWTAQCPHRHTMNTTYPELNKAKNNCRNPQNSGKRPWCFTTDRSKRWEYCDIPKCISVDGNYGNWSLSSQCNVSCGQGVEIWRRICNNPTPRYGGKNCSHLGNSTEYRQCTRKPCPVNGRYGNWTLSSPCSVSCAQGFEIWKRFCDNPPPRNGGSNCSVLGNSTSIRQCTRKLCPIDGKYGNWTQKKACSRSCGKGSEIWTRECNDPLPEHGGNNCTKQGPDKEIRECNNKPCPVKWNVKMIGIITGAGIGVIVLVILISVFVRRRRRRKKNDGNNDCVPYAVLNFDPQLLRSARPGENSTVIESPSHGAHNYQNFTSDGKPSPGLCRGIVKHQRAYVNILESIKPWYTKLQLLPPIAIDWLRNAWGNVDEFGRHAYDVLQRVRSVFMPYNKLKNVQETDNDEGKLSGEEAIDETSTPIYNSLERSCEAQPRKETQINIQ